jgi:hypothetical protein
MLDYGQRRRRRVPVIKSLVIVVLLSMIGAGWYFRREIANRYRMYSLQRQCMNYCAPADQVAYEGDKAFGDELMKRDAAYEQHFVSNNGVRSGPSSMEGTFRPVAPWEKLFAGIPPAFHICLQANQTVLYRICT